jgi:hypothetical protein
MKEPSSPENRWRRVIFAADCDEEGDCPICKSDYALCDCPRPTMEDYEYRMVFGVLYGRPKKVSKGC